MNKLYCPQCRFLIEEEYPIRGEEVFCQNCLAWSFIEVDIENDEFYLEFSRWDKGEK